MSVALHRRDFELVTPVPAFGRAAAVRFRITVRGSPKTPWRPSIDEAMADAIDMDLASWDATARTHFLAVPVEMQISQGDLQS